MLALIAGTGALPAAVVNALAVEGVSPLVCIVEGFPPDVPDDLERVTFRLETLGTLIATLKSRGVTELCMAGAMSRPDVDPSRIDAATMPLVPRLMAALGQGDDGALRVVMALFEENGIAIRAAHEIAPALLPPSGVPTKVAPTDQHKSDAMAAVDFVADMGRRDVGQACIVRGGELVAEEGPDGTDAMIKRLHLPVGSTDDAATGIGLVDTAIDTAKGLYKTMFDDVPTRLLGEDAILFKAPKPAQDRRADLPVIGPETARNAAEAGLAGIVIEAGGVMVMDIDEVLELLDINGMFLWVRQA